MQYFVRVFSLILFCNRLSVILTHFFSYIFNVFNYSNTITGQFAKNFPTCPLLEYSDFFKWSLFHGIISRGDFKAPLAFLPTPNLFLIDQVKRNSL